jgi:DNA replication and repair protein RecF
VQVVGVELRDFRTYARAEARLGAGLTVVHGANGAGKSNLLEAIYYGCTARSVRTRNERELVRFGAEAARVTVRLLDGREQHEGRS